MPEIANAATLDIGPALAGIDKLLGASEALADSVNQGRAAMQQSAADIARQATAYSDSLARQQGEVRAASAAVASAREELRRLTDQQNALNEAQKKAGGSTAEYERLTRELTKNAQAIQQVKAAIAESVQATRDEKGAVDAIREGRRQEANAAREVAAANKDAAAAARQEAAAEKEAAGAAKQQVSAQQQAAGAAAGTAGAASGLTSALGKIGGVLGGLAVFSFAKRLGGEVLEVTADFQRMEAVLTTIFDGDQGKAQRVFAQLRQFTLNNPFEVASVTESYVKLRNVGINPSIQQFQQLADLAAASGKDIGTATDTLLGASTGRVAQLRQLGIVAKVSGDEVTATFRGQTTVIQNNQQAIADYVLGLGALQGVVGATARIMETTGGRVTNLKDTFTELFNAIGEGTGGPVNAFIRGLTEITKGVTNFLKSDKQKIAEAAAGPVQIYEDSIDQLFKAAVDRAKKNGTSASEAVAAVVKGQQAKLAQQLAEAQKQVDFFTLDGSKEASLRQGNYRGGAAQFKADAIQAQAYLQYVQAGQKALQDRSAVALKTGNDEEQVLGRIQALRAQIERNTKARDETADTRAGNAERVRLNALLKDEGKELDELLGKEQKVRAARQYSYETQLRALLQERQTLTGLAAKAAESIATDGADRAKLVFDEALRQIDATKAKLSQRETDLAAAARKAGGQRAVTALGDKADGRIDGVQDQQLATLRNAAAVAYVDEVLKLAQEREQRLFDLQKDSDRKQEQEIDRHYSDLNAKAKDNVERAAIEQGRLGAQEARRIGQEQGRIGRERGASDAAADVVSQTYGSGTGTSVFEAEQNAQGLRLASEREFLEQSLALNQAKTDREAGIEKDALAAQLARVKHQQDALKIQQKLSDFSIYKLILGENDNEQTRAALDKVAGQVVSSLEQITDAEQQAAQARASNATQNINELTGQLAAQIQLNQEGSASNIKGLQDQIAQERQIRRQALDDQRTAAKEKVLIDTLTQASSIATAAAEVFATFAALGPLGIVAGIAGAGVLIGAFAAAKIQAYQAASQIGGSFFVGGYTGEGDPRQSSTAIGPRPYEYHRREFVMPHDLTDQYRHSLFEPLHQGKPLKWEAPEMQALLPDLGLPARMAAEKAAHYHFHQSVSLEPVQQELRAVRAELAEIKGSNSRMADRPDRVTLGPGRYMEVADNGSTHIINVG